MKKNANKLIVYPEHINNPSKESDREDWGCKESYNGTAGFKKNLGE